MAETSRGEGVHLYHPEVNFLVAGLCGPLSSLPSAQAEAHKDIGGRSRYIRKARISPIRLSLSVEGKRYDSGIAAKAHQPAVGASEAPYSIQTDPV